MTQKQKAKAYDKAYKKVADRFGPYVADEIFTELKESKDEKIRKDIISYLKSSTAISPKTWIAWLEKQCEQKDSFVDFKAKDWYVSKVDGKIHNIYHSVDKVEPKFHEGEWITNGDYTWKIVEVKPLDYILQSQDGNIVDDTISHVDEQFHSFTIEDAKTGDVLVNRFSKDNIIILYKGINPNLSVLAYCGWNGYNLSIKTNGLGYGNLDNTNYSPATKEQRDLLFLKMKEAGYKWDSEKKELKEIEQKPTDEEIKEALRTEYEKGRADAIVEMNNPAWSEEDEEELDIAISTLKEAGQHDSAKWLKSLKSRVQPKQEWSEEDECYMSECIGAIATKDGWSFEEKRKTKHWLKSLKDRVQSKPILRRTHTIFDEII